MALQLITASLLEKTLSVVPDHTPAMQMLASFYLQDKRLEDACALLSRITQIPSNQDQFDSSKKLYQENRCDEVLRK